MDVIKFKDLNFFYPNSETKALNGIDIGIRESDFILVCGKSGCGKSTLLRHIKKEVTPHGNRTGEILYRGTPLDEIPHRVSTSEIGFVGQSPENQIVTDKVWHELAFGLENLGFDTNTIRRQVAEMAGFFGIQTWFRRSVCELSGGQKQLLNLASIMVMHPKVLLLDEPTSQLDPIAAMDFLETLAKINRELGTTIILSEHRLEEVFPIAHRVLVMDNGSVSAYASPREIGAFMESRGDRHPIFKGLPTPMKVFSKVGSGGACPITIREGRLWLHELIGNDPPYQRMVEEKSIVSPVKPDNGKDEVLSLSNIWFRYEKKGPDILRGLSLSVKKGQLVCMVGGNGTGKTTALKLIAGINKPYRGKVCIGGRDIKKYSQRELFSSNLGLLPQNPLSLFSESTVLEELYDVLYFDKIPEDEKLRKIHEILSLLELGHLEKSHPYDLSGGEQQRLALGKILLLDPKILLLDEPTKGLDPHFKTIFAGILMELKTKGVTIIMVTHDIEFCAEYADICAMFFDGDIVSMDTPRNFFSQNSFYTTGANRMSRHLFDDAITYEDVILLCRKNLMDTIEQEEKEPLSLP